MRRLGSALCIIIFTGCSQMPLASSPPTTSNATTRGKTGSNFQILHAFNAVSTGRVPAGAVLADNGTLYGTTNFGGKRSTDCYPGIGCGTVYEITASNTFKVLYRFHGRPDGTRPYSGLIDLNGTLYGTTQAGGKHNQGTIFSLTPSGSEHVIFSFDGKHGNDPRANLMSSNGTMYGTTYYGGGAGSGTVFSITPSGTEKVLHNFQNGTDGSLPFCALVEVNGLLYGTTASGGVNNAGTVFAIDPSGKNYSVLYSFQGGTDGAYPYAGLTEMNGTLYGTTLQGGANNKGTVFSITTSGSEQVIHSLGQGTDGAYPYAALTVMNNLLYGTTAYGGTKKQGPLFKENSQGTIFSITPSGSEQVIHNFTGGPGGRVPYAGVTVMNGALYGATIWGGNKAPKGGEGTVYEYAP